jgi:hypothetical protein
MKILTDDTPPPPNRRWRRPAAGLLAILLLGAGVYVLGHRERERLPAHETTSSSGPSKSATIPRAASTGALEITANVDGPAAIVDGRAVGAAPRTVGDLAPGAHRVRLELAGYEPWDGEAHVTPGHTARVSARLVRTPTRLRVDSDVAGAQVFIDQKYVGITPLDLADVARGTHKLNVSAEGYDLHVETIDVGDEARAVSVRFKEMRLDERLAVLHRHASGSCSGLLVASPQGVRYEATNAKDAFEVPLDAIEQMEVDYLKKNLRLKVRGGRRYNFTVESGSADPLLVFQQQVDRARQRLSTR